MIHPALIHQLATAHIDDLRRGAADQRRLDSSRSTAQPQEHQTLPARGHVGPHATSGGEVTSSSSLRVQSFTRAHTRGALDLFAAEGWGTYTVDPERTVRALSAPGCMTLLALDGATVVALVQLQSDGEIQAHLSALIVARSWRRRGLGRQLLHEALKRAGGIRIDVLTETEAFYESLGGQRTPGFRLIQHDLNLDEKADRPPATLLEVATNRHEAHAHISAEDIRSRRDQPAPGAPGLRRQSHNAFDPTRHQPSGGIPR